MVYTNITRTCAVKNLFGDVKQHYIIEKVEIS